jgi:hypothetical protein
MDANAIAAMLDEDRREWAALGAALDAHPDVALHEPPPPSPSGKGAEGLGPAWTARDVYAHLARWITHSTDDLETVLAGGAPAVIEGTDDEINARWQAEGAGLSLTEARRRAHQAFERRLHAIEAVPSDRWSPALEEIARADGADHYRGHRRYLRA